MSNVSLEQNVPVSENGLASWVHEMCTSLDIDILCDQVVDTCTFSVFSKYADDHEFNLQLRASVRENLKALQNVLCQRIAIDQVRLSEPLKFASVQAQLGIPQTAMQKSYRVSFRTQWKYWTQSLHEWAELHNATRDEATAAIEWMTDTILEYQDHVASLVAETHSREGDSLNRSRTHIQHRLIRDILKGDGEALTQSDLNSLGYDFEQSHVALLLPNLGWTASNQILIGLRSVGLSSDTLVYPVTLQSTIIWLAKRGSWSWEAMMALSAVVEKAGLPASMSSSKDGLAGFRECCEEVRQVEKLRAGQPGHSNHQILHHREVALEILLLKDTKAAIRFVRGELGPLSGENVEAERLRETLEASFRLGSHVATAEYLKLHEHTVRNRLHKAEELLGQSLLERRVEIQVALRVRRFLTKK